LLIFNFGCREKQNSSIKSISIPSNNDTNNTNKKTQPIEASEVLIFKASNVKLTKKTSKITKNYVNKYSMSGPDAFYDKTEKKFKIWYYFN